MALSDRIAIFRHGEVMQTGKPDEIYERPRSAFAAEFLGATNILSGRAAGLRGGAGVVALGEGGQHVLTLDPLPAVGAPATITVRPEKFSLSADAPAAGGGEAVNSIAGQILQQIYMGAAITYRVDVGGSVLTVFHPNRESRIYQPGEAVWLSWSARHSILLQAP